MSLFSAYLSSPAGFTAAGRHYRDTVLVPALSAVVTVVDPWALTSAQEFIAAARWQNQEAFAVVAGRRNLDRLRDCQLLVADLDGPDIDSGVAADIGFAAALSIPCHGLRTDSRPAGSRGTLVNLEVQTLIAMSGGQIHDNLDTLVAALGLSRAG